LPKGPIPNANERAFDDTQGILDGAVSLAALSRERVEAFLSEPAAGRPTLTVALLALEKPR
jgi:hypothetical protein